MTGNLEQERQQLIESVDSLIPRNYCDVLTAMLEATSDEPSFVITESYEGTYGDISR